MYQGPAAGHYHHRGALTSAPVQHWCQVAELGFFELSSLFEEYTSEVSWFLLPRLTIACDADTW